MAPILSALLHFLAALLDFFRFRERAQQAESELQGVADAQKARQGAEREGEKVDEKDPFLRD